MNQLDALFAEAYTLQYQGQLPQAISLYQQILTTTPTHQDSLHFLGLSYAQMGQLDHALLYLLQAKEAGNDAAVLNNLANVYKKLGREPEAIAHYQQAIALKPDYAQAHNNLAAIYARQNNYQQALNHYIKAVHAEPDFSAAHFNLGLLLLQHKQLTEAKIQFKNVIALTPNHVDAYFYLGVLNLEENVLDEATAAFEQVLHYDNEYIQALTNLGVIALKKEQNQLAVDYFSKALALDNDDIDARNNLAGTFMHHDRFENALMHYDVLLKKEPQNPEYLYNSGVAEMALGHLNEATVFFEQLLALNPQHAASLNNMAAIYLKQDMRETARQYLEQALLINPEDVISKHMLSAISGESPGETTPDYAQNLFNNYALYYDQHMQGQLNYAIPQHIGRMLHELSLVHSDKTLDLGCGTGLTGIVLREISSELTGVDIAEKMLGHAREKQLYDHLVQAELLAFLATAAEHYDLIVAADVLPYFADLAPLFKAVSAHLNSGAYFIFSIEINTQQPWLLQSSARFSHNPAYIEHLSAEHQLNLVKQQQVPARLQNQVPLEVMLFALQRS